MLIGHLILSFVKCLLKNLLAIYEKLVVFFLMSCSFLYILNTSPLSDIHTAKNSQLMVCLFPFLIMYFCEQKFSLLIFFF